MTSACRSLGLTLGVSPAALLPELATLLALQRAEEPETAVRLLEARDADLAAGLQDGRYDLGMAYGGVQPSAVTVVPLWPDELVVAVPLRSPLLAHVTVPLEALQNYPLLQWSSRPCEALSLKLDALFGKDSGEHSGSFEWIAVMVASGYGVCIAPRSRIALARDWGLAMRPLSGGPYRVDVRLLWQESRRTPAAERFVERAGRATSASPDEMT